MKLPNLTAKAIFVWIGQLIVATVLVLAVVAVVTFLVLFILCSRGDAQDWETAVPDSWRIYASCVSHDVEGLPYVTFGYSVAGDWVEGYHVDSQIVSDSQIVDVLPPTYLYPGSEDVFSAWVPDGISVTWVVTLYATGETQSVTASEGSLPECGLDLRYGPDGGWVEITKCPVASPFHWERQDEFGTWAFAAGETPIDMLDDQPCSRLVLGRDNADTDPSHYRVIYDGS